MYRVQAEVDEVLGNKAAHISAEDLEKLEYMEQVHIIMYTMESLHYGPLIKSIALCSGVSIRRAPLYIEIRLY